LQNKAARARRTQPFIARGRKNYIISAAVVRDEVMVQRKRRPLNKKGLLLLLIAAALLRAKAMSVSVHPLSVCALSECARSKRKPQWSSRLRKNRGAAKGGKNKPRQGSNVSARSARVRKEGEREKGGVA
jgi:hypothetical protein